MSSSLDLENLNYRSCWDEPPSTTNNNIPIQGAKTSVPDVKAAVHTMQLQLLGVIGVILIVIAVVVPVTIVISGIKISNTTCCSNTTTMTSTTSTTMTSTTSTTTTTTTVNPYLCSNMTVLVNTDLGGNDITPFPTLNYSSCCALCLTTLGCVALTWGVSTNLCYRKTSPGSGGTYSAVLVSARY